MADAPDDIGGTPSYLHADTLGSIRLITSDAGEKAEKRVYRPFGEMESVDEDAATADETRGWIGERYDAGAGLQYLNARYYDPELGLFLQPDWFEVTEPGVGTNRYAYSFNDPVNLSDPSGNVTWEDWWTASDDSYNDLSGYGYEYYDFWNSNDVYGLSSFGTTFGTSDGSSYSTSSFGSSSGSSSDSNHGSSFTGNDYRVAGEVDDILYGCTTEEGCIVQVLPFGGSGVGGLGKSSGGYTSGANTGSLSQTTALSTGTVRLPTTTTTKTINKTYVRPSYSVTASQRASVQGKPCVTCGTTANRMVADHKLPLVVEYYTTGGINTARMRSIMSVQPQCPTCSARQGANLRLLSIAIKNVLGL